MGNDAYLTSQPPDTRHRHPFTTCHSWLPERYQLLKRLGSGASGEVWEALVGGNIIALKILKFGANSRFDSLREHQAVQTLSHVNIVRFHNIYRDQNGNALIEMERVSGTNLSQLTEEKGGFLAWKDLKPLALQLCDALSHAHQMGVIHRDIKPSNLLVDNASGLKVVDFGCAAMAFQWNPETTPTIDIVSSGTLPFMSPQQINAETPSAADDIYATGATLYSLLVGAPPFIDGHLVHQILNVRPLSVAKHQLLRGITNPVPQAVARTLEACLAKNASLRPATAAALREMLERESCGEKNRRKTILTLAGCGLGLAFGGGFSIMKNPTSPPPLERGFKLIFDGKSLDGWCGSRDVWQVADNTIIARLNGRRMADASNWHKDFLDWMGNVPDNFELRLQVRLALPYVDAGNLGIRYRISHGSKPVSYDLDFEPIWKYNCGLREFGGRDMLARPSQIVHWREETRQKNLHLQGHLANESQLKRAYREDDWNHLTIRAQGNRLVHILNGVNMVDCVDDHQALRRLEGGIGLKVLLHYGPWVEARFRHLRLCAI